MKRLLIIEDNEDFVRWFSEALVAQYDVDSAGTYAQGIEKMKRGGIDLVIVDLRLPDSTVEQTLAQLPMVKALANCPIIVTTGHPSQIPLPHSVVCDAFLQKPFNGADLSTAVAKATRPKKTPCMLPALLALTKPQCA